MLLLDDVEQTHKGATVSIEKARAGVVPLPHQSGQGPPGHVQQAVAATCGMMYKPLTGKLTGYPIPQIRLPAGHGQTLLDIGCNWGWSW